MTYFDSSQHASSGHAEVQIGQHLSCGRFVDVWRTLSGEIVCVEEEVDFKIKVVHNFPILLLVTVFTIG